MDDMTNAHNSVVRQHLNTINSCAQWGVILLGLILCALVAIWWRLGHV